VVFLALRRSFPGVIRNCFAKSAQKPEHHAVTLNFHVATRTRHVFLKLAQIIRGNQSAKLLFRLQANNHNQALREFTDLIKQSTAIDNKQPTSTPERKC
jgi:hypothetical protein